jgi:hypothetical protein
VAFNQSFVWFNYWSIGYSNSFYANAAEEALNEDNADVLEGEEEANVEENQETGDVLKSAEEEEEDENESVLLKPSPDIDTFFLFTKPSDMGLGFYQYFYYICWYILCLYSIIDSIIYLIQMIRTSGRKRSSLFSWICK